MEFCKLEGIDSNADHSGEFYNIQAENGLEPGRNDGNRYCD